MDVRLTESPGNRPEAPPAVRWITRTLEDAGYETWAVGGAVRDVLLGHGGADWDLATRARPSTVRRLFRRTVPLGVAHGTVGVLARDGALYEVTTFRRDVLTDGRHAVVEFADTLEEDLARRDFTINAIAWHPLRGEFSDPHGGVADLEARVLRTVGDPDRRFAEDYLRVLRALRFAGRFGLTVEPSTWRALSAAAARLDRLSRERVREELMKVLSADPTPARALHLYRASGALEQVSPEMASGVGARRPGARVDAWELGVALAQALPRSRPLLRLTALLQGALDRPGAVPTPEAAAAFMLRLRFSHAQVESVTALLAAGPDPPRGDGAALRRWLSRTGPERTPDLARLWIARCRVLGSESGEARHIKETWRALRQQVREQAPLTLQDLALDGRDLIRMGLRPGPGFRTLLLALLERVLDDPRLNERETLAALALSMAAGPGAEAEGAP